MSKPKMRPLWSQEACWACGEVCLATRTEPRPADEPHYCPECEIHLEYIPKIDALRDRINGMRNTLDEALSHIASQCHSCQNADHCTGLPGDPKEHCPLDIAVVLREELSRDGQDT